MEGFKIIVFTSPLPQDNEAEKICRLIEAGVDYVHVRKPVADEAETSVIKNLLIDIPADLRCRLTLHDAFHLAETYGAGGVHLNSRHHIPPVANGIRISKSFHTERELSESGRFNYVTISPLFNSISKQGYNSRFMRSSWRNLAAFGNVVALGGVTLEVLPELSEAGFYGGALLGEIWNKDRDFETTLRMLKRAKQGLKH